MDQRGIDAQVPALLAEKTKAGRDMLERTSQVKGMGKDGVEGGVVREGFSEEVTSEKRPGGKIKVTGRG